MGDPAFCAPSCPALAGTIFCCGATGCAGGCALHERDALGETCCSVRLLGGCSWRVVGLVSHVDSWLEFGAARWGGGAVDPLGVLRERLCRQLPDDGAGVGGPGGDEPVDAVGMALIHQQ